MNKQLSEQALQQKLAELPKEMAPERDLWLGVEKAIQHKEQQLAQGNKSIMPVAWAASFVAAVLLSWLVFKPEVGGQSSSDALLVVMQKGFEQQKTLMLASFGQPNLTELPSDIQLQLDELKDARTALENAIVADPTNTELINILRWTQKQELNLLKQLYSPQWQTI